MEVCNSEWVQYIGGTKIILFLVLLLFLNFSIENEDEKEDEDDYIRTCCNDSENFYGLRERCGALH